MCITRDTINAKIIYYIRWIEKYTIRSLNIKTLKKYL